MNSQRSKDLSELKKQAIEYYTVNAEIPKKVEDALNSLFYESPYDAFGYLSEYFTSFSRPAFITRFSTSKYHAYDQKCQLSFNLEVYCQDKNKEIKILSMNCPSYNLDIVNDSCKIQSILEDDTLRNSKLDEVKHLIENEINHLIRNHNPFDQEEIDEKLIKFFTSKQTETLESNASQITSKKIETKDAAHEDTKKSKTPTSPKQKPTTKLTGRRASQAVAVQAVSMIIQEEEPSLFSKIFFYPSFVQAFLSKTVCLTSHYFSKKQLFEHINDLNSRKYEKFSMPIPLITVLKNGKGFYGKQNLIKEFILMPKSHVPFQKGVDLAIKINKHIRDTLYQSKQQPGAVNKCVTEDGSLTCSLDTPQQGIDLIENAITAVCGSEHSSDDVNIVLSSAADELYDSEKNKYEIVTGTMKSADEIIEQYSDLINRNPRIIMIIDPFNHNDQLPWYKLYLKVGKYCLLANHVKVNENIDTAVVTKAAENLDAKIPDLLSPHSLNMPVNIYKFENTITYTGLTNRLAENESKNLLNALSCSQNETDDTFLSDLSVANQVKFIKIGGIFRMERMCKINRLIDIENYLNDNDILIDCKDSSRDVKFPVDFEIPGKYMEMIHSSEEAAASKKTTIKK